MHYKSIQGKKCFPILLFEEQESGISAYRRAAHLPHPTFPTHVARQVEHSYELLHLELNMRTFLHP